MKVPKTCMANNEQDFIGNLENGLIQRRDQSIYVVNFMKFSGNTDKHFGNKNFYRKKNLELQKNIL